MNKARIHLNVDVDKISFEKRKRIVDQINKMENYDCIYKVGEILAQDATVKNDKSSYTINSNGFHIRISKLSDETLKRLDHYLRNENRKTMDSIDNNTETQKGSIFDNLTETPADDNGIRLSSKEKKFFKKINNAV